ncbi:MAG: hypothetical protein HUJ51_01050 [Eggerthellaceae bacterium]|nr:hypothetical protein [Eggerthellaceae bacterium]
MEPVVAVGGATDAVSFKFVDVLHVLNFPMSDLKLFDSLRSVGKKVYLKGVGKIAAGEYEVVEIKLEFFQGVDIDMFSAVRRFPKNFMSRLFLRELQ